MLGPRACSLRPSCLVPSPPPLAIRASPAPGRAAAAPPPALPSCSWGLRPFTPCPRDRGCGFPQPVASSSGGSGNPGPEVEGFSSGGSRSPERKASETLLNLFTFVAARIVMLQLEGSGRGGLGAWAWRRRGSSSAARD